MHRRFSIAAAVFSTAATLLTAVPTFAADYIRTISGVQYAFKDYTYTALASDFQNMNQWGRLYVPDNYNPNQSYPIVVFMHGAGETGTDNTKQVTYHIDNLMKAARSKGFLVYAPQAPYTYYSDDMYNMVQNAVARASSEYNVDTTRIYATGLSMGGGAMKWMMTQYPQLYAAYAPLSTPNNFSVAEAQVAVGKPIWYFHGRQDNTTSPVQSDLSVQSIVTASGGTPPASFPTGPGAEELYTYGNLRYTQYRDYGHDDNVWNNGAYADKAGYDLYDWMLAQHSTIADLQPGKSVAVNLITTSAVDTRKNTISVTNGKAWNTIGRDGTYHAVNIASGFLADNAGTQTNTSAFVSKAFGSIGSNVPAGVTAFGDANLSKGYWMTSSGQAGEIKITGLTPGSEYNLEVFASIAATNYKGLYTVDGKSVVLDASNNLSNLALFNSVFADANGSLFLTVTPTGGSNFAVLNSFNLIAVPEPGVLGVALVISFGLLRRRAIKAN